MPTRIFGPSKGNRRPTQVAPSKTPTQRPTAQKGGGGNKAAGSPEPTAATTPTVSVSPTGEVTSENVGPLPAEKRAARRARTEAQESRRRVQKVKTYVRQRDRELTPKREVHVSKGFLDRQQSPKPVTVKAHERPHPSQPKQTIPVAEHQRALPTRQEKQQARQKVREAKREVAQTSPQISGLRNEAQAEFAEELSKKTGIPPKLAGEWVLQESGASSAGAGGEAGEQNQLGVGYPAHPTPFSESPYFNQTTPKKAADATAKWIEGKIGADYNYQAAPSIQNIAKLAKSGASEQQVREYIEGPSAWGTGQIAQSGVTATPGKANPKAIKNLKAAVKEARELGLKVSSTGIQSPGPPPKKLVKRTTAAEVAMKEVDGLPYVWGGGHGAPNSEPTGGGLDCSGAVGYVLNKIGALKGSLTSGEMGSVLKPGPGALTVYYNAEHTFLSYVNKKGETIYWGTSVGDSGAGGLGPHPTPSSDYLAQYNVGHVPGMGRKQALQLGAAPGSFTSAGTSGSFESQPGMSFSEGGTVATIEEGQGTKKQGKPGFSKKPIELTPWQELKQRVHNLQQLGVDVALPGGQRPSEKEGEAAPTSSLHSQLKALEKKYAIGAV